MFFTLTSRGDQYSFPRRSLFLPEEISIPSQTAHYSFPEEISIPSRAGQYSRPAFARYWLRGVRAKKVLICWAFAVGVPSLPGAAATGFTSTSRGGQYSFPGEISIPSRAGQYYRLSGRVQLAVPHLYGTAASPTSSVVAAITLSGTTTRRHLRHRVSAAYTKTNRCWRGD
jgi:hypothetical protein